jgi:hypothetical protein
MGFFMNVKVFVVDAEGKPCLPTKPRRARQLLKQGRAIVKQVVPFTVQLKKTLEKPVGSFEVGIDDGAKYVGIAIKNQKTDRVVFTAQLGHRQDVSKKVGQRKDYRRARRFRLRYRQPRFDNRTKKDKLVPSIRQRKEAVLRVIKDMGTRLNIVKVIVEEVKFNHVKYAYGKFFSLVEIGKKYLKEQIENLGLVYEATFGYITKANRIKLGLTKSHSHDACAIINSYKINSLNFFIKPKRTKVWEDNPTKTCTEKNGFRHYDLIKVEHKKRGIIIGSIRSLKANCIMIRTKWDDNFPVSYNKSKLLYRFNGLLYSY